MLGQHHRGISTLVLLFMLWFLFRKAIAVKMSRAHGYLFTSELQTYISIGGIIFGLNSAKDFTRLVTVVGNDFTVIYPQMILHLLEQPLK